MPNYNSMFRRYSLLPALFLSACGSPDKTETNTAILDTTSFSINSNALMGQAAGLPPATDSLRLDDQGAVILGGLSWTLPAGWTVAPPSGPMRVGELQLPGGGSFAVFRFGNGGGSVASNLDRWKNQFTRRDTMWTETSSLPGFPIHLMVVEGAFEDGMGPHGLRDSAVTKDAQGLLGAILETPNGLVVLKAVLPVADARAKLPVFRGMLTSVRSRNG